MTQAKNNSRTRVKVCGITRPSDAVFAVSLGVDAIGMIVYADSPRKIDIEQAKSIRSVVPAFVSLVGVYVNATKEFINQTAQEIGLDVVQLHGSETNDFGQSLNTEFVKAIRAKDPEQVNESVNQFPDARAILLDPYVKGQAGGTGHQLETQLWPRQANQALVLAGGLSPTNLQNALSTFKPYAVDLNSGLESSPGIKNAQLLENAMRIINNHSFSHE